MAEFVQYLDNIGHKLGIGGFEGVIGAAVLFLAAIVLIVNAFTFLRKGTSKREIDGHLRNPLEWMEDAERTIGFDHDSQVESPSMDILHIWHKKN